MWRVGLNLILALSLVLNGIPAQALDLGRGPAIPSGIKINDGGLSFFWQKEGQVEDKLRVLDWFFTALAIPKSDWWVNLKVAIPDAQAIGQGLAYTDLGRALLEADLRLKQRAMELISEVSADFPSDDLREARFRLWITPKQGLVSYDDDEVKIENAMLGLNVEADNPGLTAFLSENLVPALEKEINRAPRFAELRAAFYTLMLADWYKTRLRGRLRHLDTTIDTYALPRGFGAFWSRRDFLAKFTSLYVNTVPGSGFVEVDSGGYTQSNFSPTGVPGNNPTNGQPGDSIRFSSKRDRGESGRITLDGLALLGGLISLAGLVLSNSDVFILGGVVAVGSVLAKWAPRLVEEWEKRTEFVSVVGKQIQSMVEDNAVKSVSRWEEVLDTVRKHSPMLARYLATRLIAEGIMLSNIPEARLSDLSREDKQLAKRFFEVVRDGFKGVSPFDVLTAYDEQGFVSISRKEIGGELKFQRLREVEEGIGIYRFQGKLYLGWEQAGALYLLRGLGQDERDLLAQLWALMSARTRLNGEGIVAVLGSKVVPEKKELLMELVRNVNFKDAPALKRLIHLAALERKGVIATDGLLQDWLTVVLMGKPQEDIGLKYYSGWEPVGARLVEKDYQSIVSGSDKKVAKRGGIDLNTISIRPLVGVSR